MYKDIFTDQLVPQSVLKEKKTLTAHHRDLFLLATAHSTSKMSVRIYPYIVDWQLADEKRIEPIQVQ